MMSVTILFSGGCSDYIKKPEETKTEKVEEYSDFAKQIGDSLSSASEDDCIQLYAVCIGASLYIHDNSVNGSIIEFNDVFNKVLNKYDVNKFDKFNELIAKRLFDISEEGSLEVKIEDKRKDIFELFGEAAEGCKLEASRKASDNNES